MLAKLTKRFISVVCLFLGLGASANAQTGTIETEIIGNQEQPKVLYIVPWQAPDGPTDLTHNFANQLQELFSHIDREEFNRRLEIVKELKAKENSEIEN